MQWYSLSSLFALTLATCRANHRYRSCASSRNLRQTCSALTAKWYVPPTRVTATHATSAWNAMTIIVSGSTIVSALETTAISTCSSFYRICTWSWWWSWPSPIFMWLSRKGGSRAPVQLAYFHSWYFLTLWPLRSFLTLASPSPCFYVSSSRHSLATLSTYRP